MSNVYGTHVTFDAILDKLADSILLELQIYSDPDSMYKSLFTPASFTFTPAFQPFSILFTCLFVCLFSVVAPAQKGINANILSEGVPSVEHGFFPAKALVLMADGTEKHIEEIKPGDLVASYDPVMEDYVVSAVTQVQVNEAKSQSLLSVMLILEELSASILVNGGLAGVSLHCSENTSVLTSEGSKKVNELPENAYVYCYDESTRRFHNFRVYDVANYTVPAQQMYNISTEQKNCIINSTVILQY